MIWGKVKHLSLSQLLSIDKVLKSNLAPYINSITCNTLSCLVVLQSVACIDPSSLVTKVGPPFHPPVEAAASGFHQKCATANTNCGSSHGQLRGRVVYLVFSFFVHHIKYFCCITSNIFVVHRLADRIHGSAQLQQHLPYNRLLAAGSIVRHWKCSSPLCYFFPMWVRMFCGGVTRDVSCIM